MVGHITVTSTDACPSKRMAKMRRLVKRPLPPLRSIRWFGRLQGSGVIPTAPPGTTAIRSS